VAEHELAQRREQNGFSFRRKISSQAHNILKTATPQQTKNSTPAHLETQPGFSLRSGSTVKLHQIQGDETPGVFWCFTSFNNRTQKETIMFGLGGTEIIIILVIGLVLFGAKRLPELGKGLGTGIREFKKGVNDMRGDLESSLKDESLVLKPEPKESSR
jgi:sec-independent protein translocase protein TatA